MLLRLVINIGLVLLQYVSTAYLLGTNRVTIPFMERLVHEEDSGTVRIANPRTFLHFLYAVFGTKD